MAQANNLPPPEEPTATTAAGMYAVIGRYSGDEGSAATAALAASLGGGNTNYPGSLGFQIVHRPMANEWILQVIDSGPPSGSFLETKLVLNQAPIDITMGVDGQTSEFYFELVGAKFLSMGSVNNLSVNIHSASGLRR